MTDDVETALRRWIRPGSTIALADGVGMPRGLCGPVSAVARSVGGVRIIVGWCPEMPESLDLSAFADVRAFMPGHSLRHQVAAGSVRYVPVNLSQVPALLAGVWRPDVLIMAVRETRRGLCLGSEVSWIGAAVRSAGVCLAELNNRLPDASRGGALDGGNVIVVSESNEPPVRVPGRVADLVSARIGARLAALMRPGATIQFGPGAITEAFLGALDVPVRVDSGIATDALVDLDARGLLLGSPLATYLSGTERLYEWADGRPILEGVETTLNRSRLESVDLVAINSALEIDLIGQVGLDDTVNHRVSGIGGHADYAAAASGSASGMSVIAMPSRRRGRETLVERLTIPVSTPRSMVDVVVTEHGHADLRGLTDRERSEAVSGLYR